MSIPAAMLLLFCWPAAAASECACDADYPYCWGTDGHCYESGDSYDYSTSTCVGTCTSSYEPPPCMCEAAKPFCWSVDQHCYASASSHVKSNSTCPGQCTASYAPPGCTCDASFPYCWSTDGYCYEDALSSAYSTSTCLGNCTASHSWLGGDHVASSFDFTQISVHVPRGYNGSTPTPLVLKLPGYGDTPANYLRHFGLLSRIDEDNFIVVTPAGRLDDTGSRYWSAWGDWCGGCGSDNQSRPYPCHEKCGDGDVEYLRELIFAVACTYNIDETRIFAYGQSNGAGMAYRLACDAADIFAGVVAFEGAPPESEWRPGYSCSPSEPISVLQIHGTEDSTVLYDGLAQGANPYKGAVDSVEVFAAFNSCPKHDGNWFPAEARSKSNTGVGLSLDLTYKFKGNDTEVFRVTGCDRGVSVELWKILQETHYPELTDSYEEQLVRWMLAQHKAVTPTIEVPACVDHPLDWKDSEGNGCQHYMHHGWCTTSGDYGGGWINGSFDDYTFNGYAAHTACCACGGGKQGDVCADLPPGWAVTPAPTPAFVALARIASHAFCFLTLGLLLLDDEMRA